MFDHLGIVVSDIRKSARSYAYMLAPLGLKLVEKHRSEPGSGWVIFSTGKPQSPFLVLGQGRPSFWSRNSAPGRSPVHVCLRAPSREAVDAFYAAALEHGARDNGAPGIRRDPFYCAFVLDLDGNNLEAGCYLKRE